MKVIAIAAAGKNGVIGKENGLPWEIPEDMKFFRDSTREQVVVMGRKTYEALGKALPRRENAVITRDTSLALRDAKIFHKLEDAIAFYKEQPELSSKNIFVIGGGEIYNLSLPWLDEVWLTQIDAEFEGDAHFPKVQDGKFSDETFVMGEDVQPQTDFSSSSFRYHFRRYLKKV